MESEYKIDIDPNSPEFSTAFREFYKNHFEDAYGLSRGEVDESFFTRMTQTEKETAKRLIRQNLELRQPHLFRAAGILKDEDAISILYKHFHRDTNLSWRLTIGQAIWRINGDEMYENLLNELSDHPDETMKVAHLDQITDLRNEVSIDLLFKLLNDDSGFIQRLAHTKLDFIMTGQHKPQPEYEIQFYKTADSDLRAELLENLRSSAQ